jgi:putative oxidoreductase
MHGQLTPPGSFTACPLIGRVLLSAIFLMSGVHKITAWSDTAERMSSEGMVMVPVWLAAAMLCEICGGLSILLGWWTRVGATVLILFLIPTTVIFHDFWTYEGAQQQMQMINFMKNLAILGGLFVLLAAGGGPWSIDGQASPSEHGPIRRSAID